MGNVFQLAAKLAKSIAVHLDYALVPSQSAEAEAAAELTEAAQEAAT